MTPTITKGNAPIETSKPHTSANAIPGNVKWPSGPATSAILRVNIKVPRYPAAAPMDIPETKLRKKATTCRYPCLCW